jgi:gamma-glutamyltranspeptidase/glutathione hydrolase
VEGEIMRSRMVATRTEVVAERGVVAGGHPLEAEAGVRMLQRGGNAVDALVAAACVGFVVEPASCGLGGYGRLSVYLAGRREFVTVDHYVRAPARATPDMFEVDEGRAPTSYSWPHTIGDRNAWGGLAVAVPGAVAGLCLALERYGALPRRVVLEPAIEAADAGVPLTWSLVASIAGQLERVRSLPAAAQLLPNGALPRTASARDGASRLDGTALARTLRRIADEGPAAFYTGAVAAAVERAVAVHGGILTAADLAAYRPKVLRERPASYRGLPYITANDQVGYEALNILDHFALSESGPESVRFRHLVAEAMGHAFVDNLTHYGDPDYARSPVAGLASRSFADARAAMIRPDRAAPRPIAPGDPWPHDPTAPCGQAGTRTPSTPSVAGLEGTSQMAAADRDGNMAALITSLSSAFGSLVFVPEAGLWLNNSMQNYDPRPTWPNGIWPGKMPIFAAPSLVAAREGRAVFGAGGSGGYRILSGVLHAFVHAVDFGMGLQAAIDAPRVHCQGDATHVGVRIPAPVHRALAAMGHRIVAEEELPGTNPFGRVVAVSADVRTGRLRAASGPAWSTAAAGW